MSLPTLQASTRPAWIEPEQPPRFGALKAVAIFDGFLHGIRAKEAAACLDELVGPLMPLDHQAWSFRSLARLDIRSAAIHASENADVLMIAAGPDQPLPDHVAAWIERLMRESDERPAMLVALHDDDADSGSSGCQLTSQLRRIASRWSMEYVPERELEQRVDGCAIRARRPAPASELGAFCDPYSQHSCTWHGGINE